MRRLLLVIPIFMGGCAELERILNIAKDTAPPVADTMYPGTGYIVGGGLGLAAGITALIVKLRKRKP